jgi:hypothetical protein
LGSGSACRSVKDKWVWQSSKYSSSDLFELNFRMRFMLILNFQDTILLVDKGENKFQILLVMNAQPSFAKGDLHKHMKI